MIRKPLLVLIATLITLATPVEVAAISKADLEAVAAETVMFDPNSCTEAPKDDNDEGPLSGSTNQQKAYNFYTSEPRGLSPAQAAGVVGNLMVESSPKIDTKATNGTHWGIVQWDAGRWAKLKTFAKDRDIYDLQVQLEFSWKEASERGTSTALKGAKSAEEAARIWEEQIEISGGQAMNKRIEYAKQVLYKYGDSTPVSSTENKNDNKDGIKEVVNKHNLHSAMIQEVGGDTVAAENENDRPVNAASTMKLVIADAAIRSNSNLDRTIQITDELSYDGGSEGLSSLTIREAIKITLERSSNVGANALLKSLGGPEQATEKITSYGYKETNIKLYYSSNARPVNKTSISDQVQAMNRIFTQRSGGYVIAQRALTAAAKSSQTNFYDVKSDANKWGGTDKVASNVGKFKVGSKDYIVGLYYEGNSANEASKKAIKQGSADLVALIKGGNIEKDNDTTAQGCCSISAAGGDGGGDSAGATSGQWQSGLQPPYILEQWAIEVLKNVAKKKGIDESNTVTEEHVIALVAFALGEGGDINNSSKFNPLNLGSYAEFVEGDSKVDGRQAFKSFDAGIEATARAFVSSNQSRLGKILAQKDSTAKQFATALTYYNRYPGNKFWAEASTNNPGMMGPTAYLAHELNLIKQVRADYKGIAGLVIGTDEKEQPANKRDTSKLQFSGGGAEGAGGDITPSQCEDSLTAGEGSGDIVAMAVKLAWPEARGTTPRPAYEEAYRKYNASGPGMADCGGFVATVMRASGADSKYPPGGTSIQEAYVKSSGKYDIDDEVTSTSELQPGDILIVNAGSGAGANGHTVIYVGPQPPNNYDEASASLNQRAGNLGKVDLNDRRGKYLRARLK